MFITIRTMGVHLDAHHCGYSNRVRSIGSIQHVAEACKDVRGILDFTKWSQALQDVLAIKRIFLSGDNRFDVGPIAGAIGERLEDDEVFSGAGSKSERFDKLEHGSPLDHQFLIGKRSERDVERNAVVGLQEKDAIAEGELTRIRDAPCIFGTECLNVDRFRPNPGKKADIDIDREPRLPPSLQRDAPDETELPLLFQ